MDNLSAHKVKGISELIEAAGAKIIYLSPYSGEISITAQSILGLQENNTKQPIPISEISASSQFGKIRAIYPNRIPQHNQPPITNNQSATTNP